MFIDRPDGQLHVIDLGDPEAPVFVAHGGWVGSWELWQPPFEVMQRSWRCIGFDHRGSGASTFPPASITPSALVDDLFAVLDHLGVQRCVLAGESLGTQTCLRAAMDQPDRFAGLVLVDGMASTTPERVQPLVDGARSDWPGTVAFFVDACVVEPDSDHLKAWGRKILLRAEPEAAARILETHAALADLDLSRLHVPTLVLHGDQDLIVPLAEGKALADAIPGAELVVLAGTGHVPTVTKPHLVAEMIDTGARRRLDLPLA